jgi:hypothetical protein
MPIKPFTLRELVGEYAEAERFVGLASTVERERRLETIKGLLDAEIEMLNTTMLDLTEKNAALAIVVNARGDKIARQSQVIRTLERAVLKQIIDAGDVGDEQEQSDASA